MPHCCPLNVISKPRQQRLCRLLGVVAGRQGFTSRPSIGIQALFLSIFLQMLLYPHCFCIWANAESFPFQKVSFQFHVRDTQGLVGREGQQRQGRRSSAEPIAERLFQILSLTPKSEIEKLDVNPNTDRIGEVQYFECLLEKPAECECPKRPYLRRWDLCLGTEAAHQLSMRESLSLLFGVVRTLTSEVAKLPGK